MKKNGICGDEGDQESLSDAGTPRTDLTSVADGTTRTQELKWSVGDTVAGEDTFLTEKWICSTSPQVELLLSVVLPILWL